MKYKILEIKRKPFWKRIFTIQSWEVLVEFLGIKKTFSAWNNDGGDILWDLRKEIKKSETYLKLTLEGKKQDL